MSDQQSTAETAADIQVKLLPADKYQEYVKRRFVLLELIAGLELVGDAAHVSIALGQFHLLKGKLETYDDLLQDHNEAAGTLSAQQP